MNGLVLLQKAIRKRLVETTAVTARVPATNILDTNELPTKFPCVIIGDGMGVNRDDRLDLPSVTKSFLFDLFTNVHVWTRGGGMIECKEIAALVHNALFVEVKLAEDLGPSVLYLEQMRFLRDPDGETAHGVLTFRVFWSECIQ